MAAKKKQDKNYLVRWGLILGGVLCVSLVTIILMIDDELLHHPNLVNGQNFEITLHFLAVLFSLTAVRLLIFYKARTLNDYYLSKFEPIEKIGAFDVSRPRQHFPGKKPYRHAVLILHGFTGSTQEVETLTDMLKETDVPFLAPMIPGFGVETAQVLKETSRKDWLRAAADNYDLLADLADEVSIVGHSLGGMIATSITKERKAKNLILCAPGLYSRPEDMPYKVMLSRRVLSFFYERLIPYLPKPIRPGRLTASDTLDEGRCHGVFQFLAVPVHAVAQVFRLQDETDILESQYDKLTIVYGTQDLTVAMEPLFERLDEAKKEYDAFKFEDSAHNVLEDRERVEACQAVIDVLQSS